QHSRTARMLRRYAQRRDFGSHALTQQAHGGLVYIADDRAANQDCVILFGSQTGVAHVVDAVVDATNEGQLPVNDHYFAMQTPEQVSAHAHQARTRIE
nr:hypothetical protein [Tanacetum cinerariifolium]